MIITSDRSLSQSHCCARQHFINTFSILQSFTKYSSSRISNSVIVDVSQRTRVFVRCLRKRIYRCFPFEFHVMCKQPPLMKMLWLFSFLYDAFFFLQRHFLKHLRVYTSFSRLYKHKSSTRRKFENGWSADALYISVIPIDKVLFVWKCEKQKFCNCQLSEINVYCLKKKSVLFFRSSL